MCAEKGPAEAAGEERQMYQITRITDRDGVAKTDPESQAWLGSMGDAKMEEGCVLIHCRYDRQGAPLDKYIRTSLVQSWKKDKVSGRIVVETCNTIYQLDPVKTAK